MGCIRDDCYFREEFMKSSIAIICCGIFLAGAQLAVAQPAPWYLWKSKLNGKTFCGQTSPGDGWEQAGGPFKKSNCTN
jgi:hypothetical protein